MYHILGQENVALLANGATCSTSIHHPTNLCSENIDGIAITNSSTFKLDFTGDPIGEWLKINFGGQRTLTFMRILEGPYTSEKNIKELELVFEDRSYQEVYHTDFPSILITVIVF